MSRRCARRHSGRRGDGVDLCVIYSNVQGLVISCALNRNVQNRAVHCNMFKLKTRSPKTILSASTTPLCDLTPAVRVNAANSMFASLVFGFDMSFAGVVIAERVSVFIVQARKLDFYCLHFLSRKASGGLSTRQIIPTNISRCCELRNNMSKRFRDQGLQFRD